MTRALIFALAAWLLTSCNTQRMICPAYQSAFVFDKSAEKKFLIYNDDKNKPQEVLASNDKKITIPARDSAWDKSHVVKGPALPIQRRVKKDRYLLLPRKTYKQAVKALQTIPMKPVYPKKEAADSDAIKKALDSAARSVTDTLTARATAKRDQPGEEKDSTYVISIAKEKFNVDQDNYMWYFRDVLVLPDVRLAMNQSKEEANAAGKEGTKAKQGFFAKLKGIFKKKPKPKKEETPAPPVNQEEDFDKPYDSTAVHEPAQANVQAAPAKKKGFSLFKKKQKSAAATKTAPPATPKKEQPKKDAKKEEDDGF